MKEAQKLVEIELPNHNPYFEGQKELIRLLRQKIESLSEAIVTMENEIVFFEQAVSEAASGLGLGKEQGTVRELASMLPARIVKAVEEALEEGWNVRERGSKEVEVRERGSKEVEVREIEKPVYIEKMIEVEKPIYVDRVVEKPIFIVKTVDQPVYIQKTVEVPIYVDKPQACKCSRLQVAA